MQIFVVEGHSYHFILEFIFMNEKAQNHIDSNWISKYRPKNLTEELTAACAVNMSKHHTKKFHSVKETSGKKQALSGSFRRLSIHLLGALTHSEPES